MKDPEFWRQKWAANKIGFHQMDVNTLLTDYWHATQPKREDRVLVPLCGKSEDLVWLAQKHDDVQGVELSPIAVRAFFAEHFYTPLVTQVNSQHELYQFDELSVYTGDFFTAPLESVDLIYDRAALVALPEEMRTDYAQRLKQLLRPGGRILLVSLDYDQNEMSGPPFSVPQQEIEALFSEFKVTRLHRDDSEAQQPKRGDKALTRFAEEVWLLES